MRNYGAPDMVIAGEVGAANLQAWHDAVNHCRQFFTNNPHVSDAHATTCAEIVWRMLIKERVENVSQRT